MGPVLTSVRSQGTLTALALIVGLILGAAFFCGGIGLGGEKEQATTGDVNADGTVDLSDAISILIYLFAGGPAPAPCPTDGACASPRVIFMVRHAEKASGVDPGLTPEGVLRAQALRETFSRARVDHVYASELRRTIETAEPLAGEHQLQLRQFDTETQAGIDATVSSLQSLPPGARVVLVGHSYTMDDILLGLGITEPVTSIGYEDCFCVVLPVEPEREPQLERLRYWFTLPEEAAR